ncbi:MAG TPA: phospholipase D family protein [Candidatus Bilamarchaeaceae archaeon]|nr:phospholipase D family protein [Candidatus Bilamarchaeaceae archaeon]
MDPRSFAAGFFSASALSIILFILLSPTYSLQPVTSPGAESEIISLISSAEHSVHIETYMMTSEEVIAALKAAKARGVDVRIILERRVEGDRNMHAFQSLSSAGIDVRWAPPSFKLVHSKMIIIDGKKVLVGSHNLSASALSQNREISVLFDGNSVRQFIEIFQRDWANTSPPA